MRDRRDYDTATFDAHAPAGPADARTPGKRTRTEGLHKPASLANLAEQVAAYLQQKSSGAALPGELQSRFSASLGADTSDVRVHTDDGAARAARSVGARAFTVGRDVFFGRGHYEPGSARGQELIAHEVAHTAQQGSGARFKLEVSAPGDAAEVEADRAAAAMVRGEPTRVSPAGGAIHRSPDPVMNPGEQPFPGYTPYDDVEEKGDKVYWREHAEDSSGKTTYDEEKSGLNLYGPEARSQGWLPNPADPYGATDAEVGAHDWTAGELMGPDNPGGWAVGFAPKQPLPVQKQQKNRVTQEEEVVTIDVQPSQCAQAQSSVNAFQGPFQQAQSSWNAMSPNVQAYFEAGKNVNFREGGLNWLESKEAAKEFADRDLSDLANRQKVGHKADGKATTTVKEMAKLSDKEMEGLKSDLPKDKMDMLQAKAGDVASKVKAVETAYTNERLAMQGHGIAVNALATARSSVNLEKLADDKDGEADKLEAAKAKKAELEKNVDDVVKYFGWGMKLLEGPKGAVDIVTEGYKEITLAMYKQALTADYDQKIRTSAERVKAIAGQMKGLSSKINTERVDQAAEAVVVAAGKMATAKATIFEKLQDAEKAHREFADQAGKQVGGKKGDMVRAAIEALPKVALVVRYCEAVTGAISVPGFSHEAGRGMLGAAQTPENFVQHCQEMAGYKTYFDVQLDHWRPLMQKLESIAGSYGLGD